MRTAPLQTIERKDPGALPGPAAKDAGQRVTFLVGERQHHALLKPVEGMRRGSAIGEAYYRIYLAGADGKIRPKSRARGIAYLHHDVLTVLRGGLFSVSEEDVASCWVQDFPRAGEVQRWTPVSGGGEYLTMPEAAACVSAYIKRKVRPKELLKLAHDGYFHTLRYNGYARPLVWEGDLPAAVRALQAEGRDHV